MKLDGPLDLGGTLRGGQAFRWRALDGAFVGVVDRAVVRLAPRPDGGADAEAWPPSGSAALARYFRVGEDDARLRRLARDAALADAVRLHRGLRLLRQDPWEATVAFLTSANNNVPRIEGILARLVAAYGERLDAPRELGAHQAFPPAERVARATEARLRTLGLGYRAPFLRETARLVARGDVDLDALRGAPLPEIRAELLRLPGVGPKVADCIALFSLDADDAFPIDRWILRAVSETFFGGREVMPREVEAFARERWGRDAGLAQQYLFHAVRLRAQAPGTRG